MVDAFEGASLPNSSVRIGSVKSNIGHLEPAAGCAGLPKALTAFETGWLAPSVNALPAAKSLEFTERVTRELALVGWRTGLELAREKGPAPLLEEEFTENETVAIRQRKILIVDDSEVGSHRDYSCGCVDGKRKQGKPRQVSSLRGSKK